MNYGPMPNSSDSLREEREKKLNTLRSILEHLNRDYLSDSFIDLKTESKVNAQTLLDNLNWSQVEKAAAYLNMFRAFSQPNNMAQFLSDKSLPLQLRLLIFSLLGTNYKFNFSSSRKYRKIFRKAVKKGIKLLPLRLAYELAVSRFVPEVNNHERIKLLFNRRDINYPVFSHALNSWQNYVEDKLNLWNLESYYRMGKRFIKKMIWKKYYKLVYVFTTSVAETFPETRGFNRLDNYRVKRIHRQWENLASQARAAYTRSMAPKSSEGSPTDLFDEFAPLIPDLEGLMPVGIWDANKNTLTFLRK